MNRFAPTPALGGAVALLCALAATGAGACGDDFTRYNRLDKLRVLALRTDPVAPAPGETAALTALIYAPPGETVTLTWSWCPFVGPSGRGYPCLVEESDLAAWSGSDPDLPPFDLGSGDAAAFANAFDPELLRRLCTGSVDGTTLPEIPDCAGGFPASIKLVARSSADEVVAVRPIRLRFDAPTEPSFNPEIDGLTVAVGGQTHLIDDTATTVVPRDVKTPLQIAVSDGAAERFTEVDEQGRAATRRERLFFTWFVETGKTRDERTLFIDGVTSFVAASENRWTVPKTEDEPRDRARIIIVARDSRGGVGWRTGTVALEPAP